MNLVSKYIVSIYHATCIIFYQFRLANFIGYIIFSVLGPLSGMIQWEASDGVHTTELESTLLKARPLHLRLVVNNPLYVFPLTSARITVDNLLTETNAGVIKRPIIYHIRSHPSLGRMYVEDRNGVVRPTRNFTQKQINESRVIYEHVKPLHELSSSDSLILEIRTAFAEPLLRKRFDIKITVSGRKGGELSRYLQLHPMRVVEGGTVSMSPGNLNLTAVLEFLLNYSEKKHLKQLLAELISTPSHGLLYMKGENLTQGDEFTALDIERGRIKYRHDGSDTLHDKADFNLYLLSSSHGVRDILLYTGSLNITVLPINDQPFKLLTETPKISVVRGQRIAFSNDDLATIDADNSPREIRYEVISGPDFGRLTKADDFTLSLHTFTQEEIDKKQVVYIHDGSNSSAKFYFQVSDGTHEPVYTVFTIKVKPLIFKLENHTKISLLQASTVAHIMSANLAFFTNAESDVVFCNITEQPKYGSIFVNDKVAKSFTQSHVKKDKVIYLQEDLGAVGDAFRITSWILDKVIQNIDIKIIVKPLMATKPLEAVVGERTRITLHHLNATQLATVTGTVPMYRVTSLPRLGRIKKIGRKSKQLERSKRSGRSMRAGRSYQSKEFTHEDIMHGKIYYVARKLRLRQDEPLEDTFHYILMSPAPDVQPAQGSLTVSLVSKLPEDIAEGRHLRPGIKVEDKTPASPSRPNPKLTTIGLKKDYFLIAAILSGLLIVLLLIALIVTCPTHRRKGGMQHKLAHTNMGTGNGIDIDVASLPPPAVTDSRPNSFMTNDMSEIDDLQVTALSTSPRPTRLHPNGGTLSGHLSDSESSWPREICREMTPSVPHCKVTPLCPEPECNSGCHSPCQPPPCIAGYPYGSDLDQCDEEWGMYETQPLRTKNPMLRKNQYWV